MLRKFQLDSRLNDYTRKALIEEILKYYFQNNIRLINADLKNISINICQEFPGEELVNTIMFMYIIRSFFFTVQTIYGSIGFVYFPTTSVKTRNVEAAFLYM